jgi:hypothetical protein
MARVVNAANQISKDDVKYLERALSGLPAGKTDAADNDADGLLKYGYHQNPYLRTFTKVLWSGYAISRNQLADGSQRFSQARRDASVSAIDQATTGALESAANALEEAMSPTGSLSTFLTELRERTMPRLWSRVCETAGLPPPSAHPAKGRKPTSDELDAAEEAEIEALRRVPPAVVAAAAAEELTAEGIAADLDEAIHALPARMPAYEDEEDVEAAEEHAAARPEMTQTAPLTVQVARNGSIDTVAELLMAAAGELLRELRVKHATGAIKLTLHAEGHQVARQEGGNQGGGPRHRRRRRS